MLGIGLMIGFCFLAPLGDATAKFLTGAFPVLMLVAVRFAVQAAVLVPMSLRAYQTLPKDMRFWVLSTLRAALHIAGIWMMISALIYLPLADALAIAFVMPFLMLLLGRYILKETVGPRRLWACVVGFAGTLMVIQPAFAAVGWPAILPLGVAVVFAFFMLVTRSIAKVLDPVALQGLNGLQALILLSLLVVFIGSGDWPMPQGTEWLWLLAVGLLGTVAHLLMTWSLRLAPSATLAPMQYLEIPFATIIGWMAFGDLPNGLAAFGIVVTMATGLYIVWCEQQSARRSKTTPETT